MAARPIASLGPTKEKSGRLANASCSNEWACITSACVPARARLGNTGPASGYTPFSAERRSPFKQTSDVLADVLMPASKVRPPTFGMRGPLSPA